MHPLRSPLKTFRSLRIFALLLLLLRPFGPVWAGGAEVVMLNYRLFPGKLLGWAVRRRTQKKEICNQNYYLDSADAFRSHTRSAKRLYQVAGVVFVLNCQAWVCQRLWHLWGHWFPALSLCLFSEIAFYSHPSQLSPPIMWSKLCNVYTNANARAAAFENF